jgi:sRNA-binding protein
LRYRALTERLKREFPLAFANPPNIQPLALNIYTQACIALPGTDERDLLKVIEYFQTSFAYWSALARPGARRVNLNGSDAGPVTAAEAKVARDRRQFLIFEREQKRD